MITVNRDPRVDDRFRRLVENATDIIYWTDAGGRFTLVNPMAARIMRYPEHQLVGRHFAELIDPGHRAAALQFYTRQFKERRPHSYYEFPAVTGTGTIVWFGQNVRTLFDDGGQVTGFEAVARDITERKELERERERLIAELREALLNVKVLRGLLPICSCCKKVRNDGGYWQQIEIYLREHTHAEFTHGLCPDCLDRYYEELETIE
jgi:PAS domain S-box-containing protein